MGFTSLLLDRNADGTYEDYGTDVMDVSVHRGCRVAASRWPTPSIPGGHALVANAALDPDSGAPYGPYPAILRGGGVPLWSGTAEWVGSVVRKGNHAHTLRLRDPSFAALQRAVRVQRGAGTLAQLVAEFTAQSTIQVSVPDGTDKVAAVDWRGPALTFIDELSRYVGGWAVASTDGWRIVRAAEVAAITPSASVQLASEDDSSIAQALGWRAGWAAVTGPGRSAPVVITVDGELPQARMPDWAPTDTADVAASIWKWLPMRAGRPRIASLIWTLLDPAHGQALSPAFDLGKPFRVTNPLLGTDPVSVLPLEVQAAGDATALRVTVNGWKVDVPPQPEHTLSITARTQTSMTWTLDVPGVSGETWNWTITQGTTQVATGTLDPTSGTWVHTQSGLTLGSWYTLTITRGSLGPEVAESSGWTLNTANVPGPATAPALTKVTLTIWEVRGVATTSIQFIPNFTYITRTTTLETAAVANTLTQDRVWSPATFTPAPGTGAYYRLVAEPTSPTASAEFLCPRDGDTILAEGITFPTDGKYRFTESYTNSSLNNCSSEKETYGLQCRLTDNGVMRTYNIGQLVRS